MSLTRWQPFREMMTLRDAMDRLFDDSLFREPGATLGALGSLPMDVIERDDALVVRASVPGFDPEKIDISLQGDVLTLRGSMEQEEESERETVHLREHRMQSFQRSIRLPVRVDAARVSAECENGVLTIQMPKAAESSVRRISVGRGQPNGGPAFDVDSTSREEAEPAGNERLPA